MSSAELINTPVPLVRRFADNEQVFRISFSAWSIGVQIQNSIMSWLLGFQRRGSRPDYAIKPDGSHCDGRCEYLLILKDFDDVDEERVRHSFRMGNLGTIIESGVRVKRIHPVEPEQVGGEHVK